MKLLCEHFSALRNYAGAEIGSPFSDRTSPTFSAALGQFIKTWAMFGAVPNGQCIQSHVQYHKVANSEGFHTSLCFGKTDAIFVRPLATCYMTISKNYEITARQWKINFYRNSYQYFFNVTYRVIHKSLWDFRTRMRNNQDRHGRKEHINGQRISPSFFYTRGLGVLPGSTARG